MILCIFIRSKYVKAGHMASISTLRHNYISIYEANLPVHPGLGTLSQLTSF